jgi:hypothetical protein
VIESKPTVWLWGKAEVHVFERENGKLANLSGYDDDGRLAWIPGLDEIKDAKKKKMGSSEPGTAMFPFP